ncbi:MAG: hypothetical protein C4335_13375 [Armatimonadota bacterium]
MKKEISPVTAAIVIIVVLAVIAFVGWRYFVGGTEAPAIDPSKMPVGGPGLPPPGMAPGGARPGAPSPGAEAGQPGALSAPQRPPAGGNY